MKTFVFIKISEFKESECFVRVADLTVENFFL